MTKAHQLIDIRHLLGRGELAALVAGGRAGLTLNERWQQVVPQTLAACSQVQALDGDVLHISASNGAIALKLRLMAPTLARKLREAGVAAESLRVVVRPINPPAQKPGKPRVIPPEGAACLEKLAQSTENLPLKRALQRLARKQQG